LQTPLELNQLTVSRIRSILTPLLALFDGLAIVVLALPLLFIGLIGALFGGLGMVFWCWGVVAWGAVEFVILGFFNKAHGSICGSARRLAYGLVAAAVLVFLIESPNTDKHSWEKTYWFLLGLVPLIASFIYRCVGGRAKGAGRLGVRGNEGGRIDF
jgi:hypothetical protein